MADAINPPHYQKEGRKECIVEMYEKFGREALINYCYITAYKYDYRLGTKEGNSMEQDFKKSIWYKVLANHLEDGVDFNDALVMAKMLG